MSPAPFARLLAPVLVGAATLAFAAATPALAAPCKDAKGKFIKCPPAKPVVTRCKANGKFAKCGTPGAKPI
ncbi:hypothetical protein [uncultured Sphingomonas sp.]|uniref:hypothetical protein n=1 Tax=uncultured Sphingomonas sp. TaxID=158754 RepID=UPI0035CA03ED